MEQHTTHSQNQDSEEKSTQHSTHQADSMPEPATAAEETNTPRAPFKHKKAVVALVLVLVILAGLFAVAYRFRGVVWAATVDGKTISRLKVIRQLERQGGKQTLDVLINKQLIHNEAKNKGITVSDTEIDDVIKEYEEMYTGENGTLDDILKEQGLTREELREEIMLQKKVEKLVADNTTVTDEEVASYIAENKIPIAADKEQEIKDSIKEQLTQDKIGDASSALLAELRNKANIRTFVEYAE